MLTTLRNAGADWLGNLGMVEDEADADRISHAVDEGMVQGQHPDHPACEGTEDERREKRNGRNAAMHRSESKLDDSDRP